MGNRGNNLYLKISGKGTLYISSKEPKEGYEKHVSEKTGAISYWKEYYGVSGYLNRFSLRDVDLGDGVKFKQLSIGLSDENGTVYIGTPLFTQKGGLGNYAKSFARYFPNIDLSRKIAIMPARMKPGEKYAPGNFFIHYIDDNGNTELIPQYYKKGVNGWPDRTEKMDLMGNKVFNYEAQDTFAMQVLKDAEAKVAAGGVRVEFSWNTTKEEAVSNPKVTSAPSMANTPPPTYQQQQQDTTAPEREKTMVTAKPRQEFFGDDNDDLPF